ncbi:hypothetical protein A4H97_02735 [Niastella yeongjuensis]|uniref:Uncharacterized protein n=1 Tax=Niastella yeongjuensis TaxID=354355 RepID=A0A1V9EXB8_9BACT|nr:hypothetical protein [Niastella yeongjuensis]OQP50771.1 hypothetical protein A4H97_02735 [Niastella yeongjuensis]SEN18750.1 hypothetical protein SAMN05660816_00397 [Niastella yeongjuensis]
MKRAAAILLLIIFLFNWFGYRLLSDYLQHRSDTQLEARLDQQQYNEASLIEIRVPLNMPYQSISSSFERYDGEIEFNGIHYKYVKRKVENGELVLLCLPNENRMRLQNARDEFFKLVNDLQHNSQNKNAPAGSIKSPITEYWEQQNNWQVEALARLLHQYTGYANVIPPSPLLTIPAQPPEC